MLMGNLLQMSLKITIVLDKPTLNFIRFINMWSWLKSCDLLKSPPKFEDGVISFWQKHCANILNVTKYYNTETILHPIQIGNIQTLSPTTLIPSVNWIMWYDLTIK